MIQTVQNVNIVLLNLGTHKKCEFVSFLPLRKSKHFFGERAETTKKIRLSFCLTSHIIFVHLTNFRMHL
jgi:hypothetical protein